MNWKYRILAGCVSLLIVFAIAFDSQAQLENPNSDPAAKSEAPPLNERQTIVASRYRRFEQTLTQMADLLRQSDPQRADLIAKVLGESRGSRIEDQMQMLIQLFGDRGSSLGDAVDRQEDLLESLAKLMVLLQSEDQQKARQEERIRLEKLLKEIRDVENQQRALKVKTDRGEETEPLSEEQKKLEQKTRHILQQSENKPGDGSEAEGKNSDAQSSEGEQGEGKPGEGEQGKGKQGEGKQGEQSPQQGQPSGQQQGQQSEQPSGESQPSSPQQNGSPQNQQGAQQQQQPQPGRESLEQAGEKMDRAADELDQDQREAALDQQNQALEQLQQAQAELEERLRQLREKEEEYLLTALESRFRKVLEQQYAILQGTQAIVKIEPEKRLPQHSAQAIDLSQQQATLALDVASMQRLLEEEGSSVAFPQAVALVYDDMQLVARRLANQQLNPLTVSIEEDLIEAIKEFIDALNRELEQKKQEQQKNQQQAGQPSPQQSDEKALIDQLAELRLIRSLQVRINRRTMQFAESEDPADDQAEMIRQLSRRQAQLQESAYHLSIGKNE